MRDREAKDFLVQQTAEQAALEHVPLSDLEKRMMYFTEVEECPENPIALNEAFEAEYDADEYEAKISKLMCHTHQRIKRENPETARQWNEAVKQLSKGDHYILILCNERSDFKQGSPSERPPHDFLKLLGTAILVTVIGLVLMAAVMFLSDHYHLNWKSGPKTQTSVWIQRALIFLMAGGYVYYAVLPWLLKRPPKGIGQFLVRLLSTLLKSRNNK